MKRYCFDTSGVSNPHETMPEAVPMFKTLWMRMEEFVRSGSIATTPELYSEMCHITGTFGNCIKDYKADILLDLNDPSWDSMSYITHYDRMRKVHVAHIAEYTLMNSKQTISLNDLTVIALAKTLGLPVVSGESSAGNSPLKRRIPDICDAEKVLHHSFNSFLMAEGLT